MRRNVPYEMAQAGCLAHYGYDISALAVHERTAVVNAVKASHKAGDSADMCKMVAAIKLREIYPQVNGILESTYRNGAISMSRCYQCHSGREEYFIRPEDGKKTVMGLCRDCYERRVREIGEAESEKQYKKFLCKTGHIDDDELLREIEREEDAVAALSKLTEWR